MAVTSPLRTVIGSVHIFVLGFVYVCLLSVMTVRHWLRTGFHRFRSMLWRDPVIPTPRGEE